MRRSHGTTNPPPPPGRAPRLLPSLDDVSHRDHPEARDPDDEPEGEVRLQEVEDARDDLQDRRHERMDVERDEPVPEEGAFDVVADRGRLDPRLDIQIKQAR